MLKKTFSLKGRIRRTEFVVSYIVYTILQALILQLFESDDGDGIVLILALLAIPIMLWFILAQSAKRAHDMDDSAWWLLFPFYLLWLIFVKGSPLVNKYGNNPRVVTSN